MNLLDWKGWDVIRNNRLVIGGDPHRDTDTISDVLMYELRIRIQCR